MQKIQSLFARNYDGDRKVRNEVVPGSEWVVQGEGVATRKFDGTCCRIKDGKLWKRYEVKRGKKPPAGFEPASEVDPVTGKQQGWVIVGIGPEDQYHREAFRSREAFGDLETGDGTYELCGPKIQGNPEGFDSHVLVRHGVWKLEDAPRTFEEIRSYLLARDIEGIVWHHADGRMVKIKKKDFA